MIEQIRKNLDEKGYHYGTIDEFLENTEEFYEIVKQVHNYHLPLAVKTNNLFYTCCIHGLEGNQYPNEISVDEIPARRKLIADNNYKVDQQWYWFGGSFVSRFKEMIQDFAISLYPDLTKENIEHEARMTMYANGDFTAIHQDSAAPGRKCAILIYLSDEKNYNDGGGKLILTDHETKNFVEDVLPVFPNYAIIDIENHSLYHAVEEVKNNFQRIAFLDFIWNSEVKKIFGR